MLLVLVLLVLLLLHRGGLVGSKLTWHVICASRKKQQAETDTAVAAAPVPQLESLYLAA
jgi:hypothetical protein